MERADDDGKKEVRAAAERLLPHYKLLHDVRIHNFHRRPPARCGTAFAPRVGRAERREAWRAVNVAPRLHTKDWGERSARVDDP